MFVCVFRGFRQVSLRLLWQTLRRQQIHPERPTLTGRRTGASRRTTIFKSVSVNFDVGKKKKVVKNVWSFQMPVQFHVTSQSS